MREREERRGKGGEERGGKERVGEVKEGDTSTLEVGQMPSQVHHLHEQ